MKNYYELLEVDDKASQEVIEKAYRTLAKKYHPDRHAYNKSFAERKLKEINEAYDVLSSPELRRKYDIKISYAKVQNNNQYNDLYLENRRLKEELQNIKANNYNAYNNINHNSSEFSKISFTELIKKFINYEKSKTKQEHIITLFAISLTIIIVTLIILAVTQIPFIANFVNKLS